MILNILFLLIVLAYAQEDTLSLESVVNLDYDEDYYNAIPINADYSPHY